MKNLVVIPAFNEEHALEATIGRLQSLTDDYELLVVNDGSADRTGEVAGRLAATSRLPLTLLNLPMNCGIGAAVQIGYQFAARQQAYEYVLQFDADGQHDATSIQSLVDACRRDHLDLCIGSRFLISSGDGFRSTFIRRMGIRFFCRLIRLLTGSPVTDPTSGLRCAGPRAWQHFADRYPDDYPEPESLVWCLRHRLRVGELPVRMHERQAGVTSIRAWRPIYYMLKVTLAILIEILRKKEPWTL